MAAASHQEPDKFRAMERLNFLASRLRQQIPLPASGGGESATDNVGGLPPAVAVQAPPRAHHQQQHKVKLKGLGSKSDSDSGFGGDGSSSVSTLDSKIKQVLCCTYDKMNSYY
jgi:hypothetical protein